MVAGAAVAAIALAVTKSPNGIGDGSGTATINWVPTNTESTTGNPPQPFTGTIGGLALSGVATTSPDSGSLISPPGSSTAVPKEVPIFIWKGMLDGTDFHLVVSIDQSSFGSPTKSTVGSPLFRVTGTYGSQAVVGDVPIPKSADLNSSSAPIAFGGTSGGKKVRGLIHAPTGDRTLQTAVVSYTVTDH